MQAAGSFAASVLSCPRRVMQRPVTTQTPSIHPSSLPGRPWKRSDLLPLTLVIVAAAAAARWLWEPGLPNQIDLLMSVYRITELQDAWRQGLFFPRWGINLNFGYGALLFNFYPPLVSYVGLLLRELGLGLIETTKVILTLQLVVGGVGVYVYARRLLGGVLPAAVAGVLYALSPYFLTVLYERGAMAEGLALALLPWLFWAAHSLLVSGRRRDLLLTAALVAAMMLAHNITALFVVPGVALYVALLALIEHRPRALLPVAGAFALGLGLAAFYWIPAILEVSATQADATMLSGGIALRNFVRPLLDIVQRTPVHRYTGETRFAFSMWQFVVGIAGTLALAIRRPGRAPLALLAAAWVVILLMQTNASLAVWEGMPIIRFIQFPWRLYGPASFCVAMLGASLFTLGPLRGWLGWLLALVAIAAIFLLSTLHLRPAQLPLWTNIEEPDINRVDLFQRGQNGSALFSDYAPKTQVIRSRDMADTRAAVEYSELPAVHAPEHLVIVEQGAQAYVLDASASQPWTLRLHNLFFPGWQVTVDGAPVPTRADGVIGIVSADIPAGDHRIEASFADTPVRKAANLITILSLGIAFAIAVNPRRWWARFALVAGSAATIWLLVVYAGPAAKSTATPVPYRADFANAVSLLGYRLDKPALCAGESSTLALNFFSAATPAADKKFFVHITSADDSAKVAQFDVLPADGFNPMTRWESGELVPQSILMQFDTSVPPGDYKVVFGMYDPVTGENVAVLSSPDTLPGDRLRLGDITIAACQP